MNNERLQDIIARLVKEADDAVKDSKEKPDDAFLIGRKVAYYEMLDILKSELTVSELNLKDYGLDIDLESNQVG